MPELPEVETVRRALTSGIKFATITGVRLHRPGLRFAFPPDLARQLEGQTIVGVHRRAKYLLVELGSGTSWLTHLGMSGTFRLAPEPPAARSPARGKHEHVTVALTHPEHGRMCLAYTDPRRFGFMDLVPQSGVSRHLDHLGPEPLGNGFSAPLLAVKLAARRGPIKSVLLDQRVVAGLGNIYVCEALFGAGIDPRTPATELVRAPRNKTAPRPRPALEKLVGKIRTTLTRAIDAGGSSLRDFEGPGGETGYFQHQFEVYGRAGAPCVTPGCSGEIERFVQSGRSTFWCPRCQSARS